MHDTRLELTAGGLRYEEGDIGLYCDGRPCRRGTSDSARWICDALATIDKLIVVRGFEPTMTGEGNTVLHYHKECVMII